MRSILFAVIVLATAQAAALELVPYDSPKVTEEQFAQYHAAVDEELSYARQAYPDHFLEVYNDTDARASIAFTLPGHAAHPAWVIRQLAEDENGLYIEVSGFFAGDPAAFARLLGQYQAMAAETMQKMQPSGAAQP